jgi:2-dehydropantoate 2-reductase
VRISGALECTAHISASCDPGCIPTCDVGILATKATQTDAAIHNSLSILGSHGTVCCLQNGIGNEAIVAKYISSVISGIPCFAGHLVGPGHVMYDIKGETILGAHYLSPDRGDILEHLAGALTRGGMKATVADDIRGVQWAKLIFNSATNPVGALTQLDHGATMRLRPTTDLCDGLIAEGEAVARQLDIRLWRDPRDLMRAGANSAWNHKTSMLQDVLSRNATEVDFINGAIARLGATVGVETPLNLAMWRLIKGLEHSWEESKQD